MMYDLPTNHEWQLVQAPGGDWMVDSPGSAGVKPKWAKSLLGGKKARMLLGWV